MSEPSFRKGPVKFDDLQSALAFCSGRATAWGVWKHPGGTPGFFCQCIRGADTALWGAPMARPAHAPQERRRPKIDTFSAFADDVMKAAVDAAERAARAFGVAVDPDAAALARMYAADAAKALSLAPKSEANKAEPKADRSYTNGAGL